MYLLNLVAHDLRPSPTANYKELCLYSVLLRHVENYSMGTEKINPKQKNNNPFKFERDQIRRKLMKVGGQARVN